MSDALFETLPLNNSLKLGVATLNRPELLNCNTLNMAKSLYQQLTEWNQDPSIAAVIMQSAGDKAFCAGGDLKGMYYCMEEAAKSRQDETDLQKRYPEIYDFFFHEYALTYLVQTYTKPVICHAKGICMGGGMGLINGARFRLITQDSQMAMPEVSIGLFPDVAAGQFLNHIPGRAGLFMAATGVVIGASDALYSGLADYLCERDEWPAMLKELQNMSWSDDSNTNHDMLHNYYLDRRKNQTELPEGPLQKHRQLIDDVCGYRDYKNAYHAIAKLADHSDPWLQGAAQKMIKGSPISMALSYELTIRGRKLSVKDVLDTDLKAALQCAYQGDLHEGIRALIIDKDKNPQWRIKSIDDVSRDVMLSHIGRSHVG